MDGGCATNLRHAWVRTHRSERITLQDGKFSRIEITFDQIPVAQAFGDQAAKH